MKKILVALAMFPLVASAQDLAVGTFELAGGSDLGFATGSTKTEVAGLSGTADQTSYGLSATGLYYVIPNLGVGLNFGYGSSTIESGGFEIGGSSFRIGPAVSYQTAVAPQLAVFGRGTLGYVSSTSTATSSPDVKESGLGFFLQAGVKYFPVKNFSFDAGLGYDWEQVEDDAPVKTKTTTSDFGLNVGLSVYFGGK